MVGFISLIFHITYYWVFVLIFLCTKKPTDIVESLFCIQGVSAEHEDNWRVKLIVEINIALLLEFDRYSYD